MTKEIVKYHNQMNEISFGTFKEKELDLFFSICYKLKEQGTKEVDLTFSELKNLIGENKNLKRLKNNIDSLNKKLAMINHQIEIRPNVFERFVLFTNFTTDYNENILTIKVNDKFSYILNNLINKYTKFDLLDFISLKSIYSKNMFKLLKQWESLNKIEYSLDEIKEKLNIPKAYSTSDFNKRVLIPIMEELPQYFSNLKLEKIKTGKKVTSLKFTWNGKQKEAIDIKEAEVVEIEISEQLNKAIEKAKKNRFIEKLLTLDNIEILTQMFQENDLVKGLLWAYKEVKQDISTLNYLIKTIRTGAEQKEIKIKVKESKNKEVIQEALFDEKTDTFKVDPVKKEKISQEKYEELYKGYLKENNIAHNRGTRLGFDKLYENKYEIIETPKEKIYTINELPKEKLLSKAGKELKGVALLMRLRKIAEEMKVSIEYNSEIIKGV
jgi:plasmid replication initiation protein